MFAFTNPEIPPITVCRKCVLSDCIERDQPLIASVFPRTLVLIMLLSAKGSEGDHAPDILRFMTTDRILAAIDEEIARLKKVRALLSTSVAGAQNNTAVSVRKRRKISAAAQEQDRRRAAEALGQAKGKRQREVAIF